MKANRKPSSLDLRSLSDDVDSIFEGLAHQGGEELLREESAPQAVIGDIQEMEGSQGGETILCDGEALQKALNTTLCPAAVKFDGSKPSRSLGMPIRSSLVQ